MEGTLREDLTTEQSLRAEGDSSLEASILSETRRAEGAESALRAGLYDEETAREAADAALRTSLNTEKRRAEEAEGALREDLEAEQSLRSEADSSLEASILSETRRAEGAEGDLRRDLTDETEAREAATASQAEALRRETSGRMSHETVRFDGFQLCPDATDYSPQAPEAIYFDASKTQFVGLKDGTYYTSWPDSGRHYNADSHHIYPDKVYLFAGKAYVWDGGTLSDIVSAETSARMVAVDNLSAALEQESETRSEEDSALSEAIAAERTTREGEHTALEVRIAELESVSVITDAEMDEVLGGDLPVYLTDRNGNAVLDDNGRPIEILS